MATAVVDVDVEHPPAAIEVAAHYREALVLFRWRGRPVAQALLPVCGGMVDATAFEDALLKAPYWDSWLKSHLGLNGVATSARQSVTVAVCTRDRPDDLQTCLNALGRLPDDGQEVLVVDNCPSNDASEQVVRAHPRVRYVREPRPGLDVARNRAVREASGEIVAFTDDDAAPDPNWLRAILGNFDHPLVLAVTGLTMPLELETEAQEWFERSGGFGRGFRRRVFDSARHHPFVGGPIGGGVNMAVRRSVVELLGPFNEALDAGTLTRSGGDHEMFSRILGAGYQIVYEPAALCWHRHRRTWEELRATMYGYGTGVYAGWTHALLFEREVAVVPLALQWFFRGQLPALVKSALRRPGTVPIDLLLAELRGCAAGPLAYFKARRRLRAALLPSEPPPTGPPPSAPTAGAATASARAANVGTAT